MDGDGLEAVAAGTKELGKVIATAEDEAFTGLLLDRSLRGVGPAVSLHDVVEAGFVGHDDGNAQRGATHYAFEGLPAGKFESMVVGDHATFLLRFFNAFVITAGIISLREMKFMAKLLLA